MSEFRSSDGNKLCKAVTVSKVHVGRRFRSDVDVHHTFIIELISPYGMSARELEKRVLTCYEANALRHLVHTTSTVAV
jgi:hypothetical protein